ncbi:aspartate dehydrogenase [Sporosarcina jiandibaonis]|uniref:aspartate dehydrogenase n=1 Tax=Sporosarcina jiandibaonis TaxID=2715535 RepID=UPI0015582349|nr:aspartate dehydrogenase [Sporosarcina jiandibaonis]
MKIGLIGCGSIGNFLLEKLNQEKLLPDYQICSVFDDRDSRRIKLQRLSEIYEFTVFQDLNQFLQSGVDLVVECANIKTVNDYAVRIVEQKDLLLISIGALANASLYDELHSVSKLNGTKVYLPSGAIGGLDVIKTANIMGGLNSVSLVSRKPLKALSNEQFNEETVLFEGSAKNAIQKFPQNANVAIVLSLAGIGIERTSVKIIADPAVNKNIHTIRAEGVFGEVDIIVQNNPSEDNAKTSYLTALSILSSLKSINEQITIG